MSGASVVATDNGGHREFAFHEQTALLSPPRSPRELAENVTRLIYDSSLRIKLARQGNQYVQQFTWERAVDAFEACLAKE